MFEEVKFDIKPIGFVESDYQIGSQKKTQAILHIFDQYKEGLYRLNEFKLIMVVFYFHKFSDYSLIVKPPHNNPDNSLYGVFATHSPKRPNHIGVSIVPILEVGENFIRIDNCDMISNTPILDIKAQRH